MRKLRLILIALLIPLLLTTAQAEPFHDLVLGERHYLAISTLQEQSVISGYQDNSFREYEKVSRAEALKMIMLATGSVTELEIAAIPKISEAPFPDVYIASWNAPYIQTALEKGIIAGHPDGNFHPGDTVNLAEALKMFVNSSGQTDLTINEDYIFSDTPMGAWFTPYTSYMGSKTILDVYSDNGVGIDQEMSRGYLAELIYRIQMSEEGYEFGKTSWYGEAFQGNFTANGEIYDYNEMTAAHKYLPLGSYIDVTNLANGETINVKVNDRGPYGPGRVVDLSKGAFAEIASLGTGVIRVQYKVTHLP